MKIIPMPLAAAAVLLSFCPARAEDAPFRVYYLGNSLTDELKYDAFAKLCESQNRKIEWARQMIPGAPIRWLWDHPEDGFTKPPYGPYAKALKEFDWDAVTIQPFSDFEGEFAAAEKFAGLIAGRKKDTQLFVYAQWPGKRSRDWNKLFSGPQAAASEADLAKKRERSPNHLYEDVVKALEAKGITGYKGGSLRDRYEMLLLGLNDREILAKPVRLIPAGHALFLLNQKMAAGQVPGYRTVWDLYSDGVHVSNVASYLVGCSFYACLFGTSPVGLPVGDYHGVKDSSDDHFPIDDSLARVIQETVWETVASHPLTGVASAEPLKIATPALEPATEGEPYRFQVLAAFGKPPYNWRLAAAAPGFAIDAASGVITAAAPSGGSAALKLEATDAAGAAVSGGFPLTIAPDTAPEIATAVLPKASRGGFLRAQLAAKGGNGILTWTNAAGRLPGGLELSPDGEITGSPGEEGSFAFTVRVADSDGAKPEAAEKAFTLEVGPAGAAVLLARKADKAPQIDGSLGDGEWSFSNKAEKAVVGKSDNTIEFDVAYTDKSARLYAAVRVLDASVQGASKGRDAVEIYIDGLNNREATYNFDDRRIVAGPDGKMDAHASITGTRHQVSCKGGAMEGGYLIEFSIEPKNFGVRNFGPNTVIGFDVLNIDDDGTGEPAVTVWQGTGANSVDPSKFGTVIMAP